MSTSLEPSAARTLRALHGYATRTERDGSGLAAVPHRGALEVVTALWADHLVDQLGKHAETHSDAQ